MAQLPASLASNEGVVVAHYLCNSLVSLAFPERHTVCFISGYEQALLLLAHVQVVTVMHVEVGLRDLTQYLRSWLHMVTLAEFFGLSGSRLRPLAAGRGNEVSLLSLIALASQSPVELALSPALT